ncbi:SRPBCC family protein [bacterium]|nr:SRPBCC family protein [candidate division CSSED10-310 bacterium]
MTVVSNRIVVNADPRRCFDVVADFSNYPRFLGDHEEAVVLDHTDEVVVVRFALRLIKRFQFTVRHHLEPCRRISWEHLDGPFQLCRGEWRFEIAPTGTLIHYQIELEPGFFIPRLIADKLIQVSIPATLKAFKQEIEINA